MKYFWYTNKMIPFYQRDGQRELETKDGDAVNETGKHQKFFDNRPY